MAKNDWEVSDISPSSSGDWQVSDLEESQQSEPMKFLGDILSRTMPLAATPDLQRNIARTGARIAESAVGLPGSIAKAGAGLIDLGSQGLQKLGVTSGSTDLASKIPDALTAEGLRKNITEPLTGDYLKPQSKAESLSDDFFGLATEIFMPLGGPKTIAKGVTSLGSLARAAKFAGAATGAGFLAHEYLPKGFEGPVKAGTILTMSLLTHKRPIKQVEGLYKEAEAALENPEVRSGLSVRDSKSQDLINSLKKLKKEGRLGGSAKKIQETLNEVELGESFPAADAWNIKKELNDVYKTLDSSTQAASDVKKGIDTAKEWINTYGDRYNLPFKEALNDADEITRAYAMVKSIPEMLPKSLSKLKTLNPLSIILLGSAGHKFGVLGTSAAALGGLVIDQASQIAQIVFKSPAARKGYLKMLSGVAKESKPLVASGFKEMNTAFNFLGSL